VAERLGVPFLDRAIPLAVAERLDVSPDDADAHDEQSGARGRLERMLRGFIAHDAHVPTPLPADTFSAEDFRRATEAVLIRQAGTGEGVIIGRGAVVVLREDPRVLRVRLTGPAERRIEQALTLGELERDTAARALRRFDRTHSEYARQFYGVDIDDPALYHLVIDSTAISLDGCVELITTAARSPARRSLETSSA